MIHEIKIFFGVALFAVLLGGHLYIRILRADLAAARMDRDKFRNSLEQCTTDKALTHEVSNDYQTRIRSLNRQLVELKRLRDKPDCVPVSTPPGGRDAGSGTGKPSGQDGVRSEWLLDYAAEAEQYRLQLISCQDFINRVYDARK